MAKYKPYDYSQSLLVPVFLQEQLMPGTLEFAIHTLVEGRMDLSVFDDKYQNDETGRRAYDPKVLLKAVLLAYSRGLISSRQIERAIDPDQKSLPLLITSTIVKMTNLYAPMVKGLRGISNQNLRKAKF